MLFYILKINFAYIFLSFYISIHIQIVLENTKFIMWLDQGMGHIGGKYKERLTGLYFISF